MQKAAAGFRRRDAPVSVADTCSAHPEVKNAAVRRPREGHLWPGHRDMLHVQLSVLKLKSFTFSIRNARRRVAQSTYNS